MRGKSGRQQAAVWLVKSSGKILGPFTEEELSSKLRNGELLVIDEVTLPMSRWQVIRDEPVFASVVEEVRKGQLNTREDTEIQGHTQTQTNTNTQNQTRTSTETLTLSQTLSRSQAGIVEIEEDDIATSNSLLSPIDSTPIDSSRVQDAEFVELPDDDKTASKRSPEKVRQYGVSDTGYETSSLASNIRVLMWSVATVVSVLAVWIYFREPNRPDVPAVPRGRHDFTRIVNEGQSAWNAGDFARALSLFRRADSIQPYQPEVIARLAPLMIQLEAQTVTAKRAVREALAKNQGGDPRIRAELELGLGLAALVSDELNEAETYCRSANASAPNWFPARFNCGVVAYEKKEYASAARSFSEVDNEPAALLMAAQSLIAMDKYGRSPDRRRAEVLVKRLVSSNQDFRQEGLVIGAFLELEAGDKRMATEMARAALDVDPDLTSDHWHDPFLYLEPLGWRSLVPFCRRLAAELKSSATRALLGLCLYKAGNRTEAGEIIADSVAQTSGEGLRLLQAVNAYIMAASGRYEDARAALKLAMSGEEPSRLATLVRARVCARTGDMACAEQAWLDLDEGMGRNLPALIGLAGFRLAKGDRIGAIGLLEKAKRLSPGYLPARLFEEVGSTR